MLKASGLASLNERMNTEDSTTVAGRGWGIELWREIYTPRQLLVLFTLIKHIRAAHDEMLAAGMDVEKAKALVTYLAMAFSRLVVAFNKFTRWESAVQRTMAAIGDRQAIKMVYDFSEINCLAKTQGCLPFALDRELFCMRELAKVRQPATVTRGDAGRLPYEDATFDAIVTDPPYYSSIYYADLSAFFYVWLRRILGDLHPEHFTLPTPPKTARSSGAAKRTRRRCGAGKRALSGHDAPGLRRGEARLEARRSFGVRVRASHHRGMGHADTRLGGCRADGHGSVAGANRVRYES